MISLSSDLKILDGIGVWMRVSDRCFIHDFGVTQCRYVIRITSFPTGRRYSWLQMKEPQYVMEILKNY